MDPVRSLRYVVAVADELSFGRAARRLGIAQPTLSRAVRAFEDAHGVVLFDRSTRSVATTAALRAALDDWRAAITAADRALAAARGDTGGEVRTGYVLGVANGILPAAVRAARRRGVRLDLTHLSVDEQVVALRQRRIDLALLRLPAEVVTTSLVVVPLHDDELVLSVPADHALASAPEPVPGAALRDEPIVFWPRAMAAALHDTISDQWHRRHGFPLRIVAETRDTTALLALVAGGIGSTLVTASTAASLARAGVVHKRLEGAPTTTVAAVHRRLPETATLQALAAFRAAAADHPG
jgi:DNA-binding transcriptional LysR family regulator